MASLVTRAFLIGGVVLAVACGEAARSERDDEADEHEAHESGELTEHQLEHGIGPVTRVELHEIDEQLSARGAEIFQIKCSACHKLDERYIGPTLGDVLSRRTPEYIMNMMLNPAEMLARHPTARQLLAEYYTPMPAQDLTPDDARALLEYLRRSARAAGTTSEPGAGT